MRTSKFTQKKRLEILAKWDTGVSIEDLCREYQLSPATLYKWKKDKAIQEDDTQRELQKLRVENARLKKMYTELSINHSILKDGNSFSTEHYTALAWQGLGEDPNEPDHPITIHWQNLSVSEQQNILALREELITGSNLSCP